MNIRQAIRTRYHGPTNSKGSRISAKCAARTLFLSYDDALNSEENHAAACAALVKKMEWDSEHYGQRIAGVFDNDYFWVEDDKRLASLRDLVNRIRKGDFSGNPWCKVEFRKAVEAIGRSYGVHADAGECPTTDEEAAQIATKGGAL